MDVAVDDRVELYDAIKRGKIEWGITHLCASLPGISTHTQHTHADGISVCHHMSVWLSPSLSPSVCLHTADEFARWFHHCRALSFTQQPDYAYLKQLILRCFIRSVG